MSKRTLFLILFSSLIFYHFNWGFYAHSRINRLAVYSLPPQMFKFYKQNIDFITENAVNPDKRRYAVKGEAARHFIDLDQYPDSIQKALPKMYWKNAIEKYGEDTLMAHGIVPWQIQKMKYQLTQAFTNKELENVIRISADLGHYIADANVPLHTTKNYNGQFSNQIGIHGFWESRLAEMFAEDYDIFIGQAEYEENVAKRSWNAVLKAHAALDSVLIFEQKLNTQTNEDKKYAIEERNGINVKNYSSFYASKYHKMLDNQVERQMKASVKMIADIWFTAWVDAGQPDLSTLGVFLPEKKSETEVMKNWLQRLLDVRKESDF